MTDGGTYVFSALITCSSDSVTDGKFLTIPGNVAWKKATTTFRQSCPSVTKT